MKRRLVIFVLVTIASLKVSAQVNDFEKAYRAFRQQVVKEYEDFRDKANKEYTEFIKQVWKEYNVLPPINSPVKEELEPPVPYNEEEEDNEEKEIPIVEVIPPIESIPQPKPISPIKPFPQPVTEQFSFRFYGTEAKVAIGKEHNFSLDGITENDIAQTWSVLSDRKFNGLINDCLELRSKHHLCDWGYLQMLLQLGKQFFGEDSNEGILLAAYVYCQSGYKMRMARSTQGKLYLLVASKYNIFDKLYFEIDGERYYAMDCQEKSLYICQASYPKEQALSLWISQELRLGQYNTQSRILQAEHFPEMQATVYCNQNLIDFYNQYPLSEIDNNVMTRWAMYANTPLTQEVKQTLYPAFRDAIQGKKQLEAVGRLLNFVQTAFVYEYDDKVWGRDRAFFAEESLYYPYCDCEDRSILFSRLVRDLVGLKVLLVFYPGHLATAVHFTEDVSGDYIILNNQKYVVCDPTYIPAAVGETMPDMDNGSARVILLE